MRVVSEASEEDIKLRFALGALHGPLTRMAANLLRVIRGAGRPWRLGDDAADLVLAYRAFWEEMGRYPFDHEIYGILDLWPDDETRRWSELDYGMQTIVKGALQFTAATELGQGLQVASGTSEIRAGIREIESFKTKSRAKFRSRGSDFSDLD